jgi:hypothetical protein
MFYSLGNFAYHIANRPATKWSYLVSFGIDSKGIEEGVLRLVEIDDGRVQRLKSREPEQVWEYLSRLSTLTSNSLNQPEYWQEIALRLYNNRYERRIQYFGAGPLLTLLKDPLIELDRFTRLGFSSEQRDHEQKLNFLNCIHNAGHSDVIQTALEIETGVTVDHRTQSTKREIEELLTWVDERSTQGTIATFVSRVKLVLNRLL